MWMLAPEKGIWNSVVDDVSAIIALPAPNLRDRDADNYLHSSLSHSTAV